MGEIVTVPKNIVLKQPLSDQVNKDNVAIHWDETGPYAVIYYDIRDAVGRVLEEQFVKIQDDDFTAFMATIGTTIKTRAEAAIWADIQAKYTVQDK